MFNTLSDVLFCFSKCSEDRRPCLQRCCDSQEKGKTNRLRNLSIVLALWLCLILADHHISIAAQSFTQFGLMLNIVKYDICGHIR